MNRILSLPVTAIIIATAFTLFSCSGDGGGGSDPVSNSSMETASSSSGGVAATATRKEKISGVFQKGPFVQGTLASLNELDNNLNPTGRPYQTLITDDKGTFEIRNVELVSPYAHLIANGFYRNEVTGNKSNAQIILQAIVDIREKEQVNVNILTHIEYYRVLDLVDGGISVKAAKRQAQKEIFAAFGIDSDYFKDSEDMTIFGESESDAALLAISVLLLGDLSEANFSQRLMDFSQAIRNGGVWNDNSAKNAIADWASGANLADIKSKILGWELASAVPAFEKYARAYWAINYGLGECNAESKDVMKQNANASSSKKANHYMCNGNYWELVAPTLACSNLTGKGYDGIAMEEPVLSCNVGTLSNPSWTNVPNWSNPVKGTYNVGATATCGSATSLTANCGSLTVIDQPTLSCRMYASSEFEGVAIAQPALSCSDGSIPFDGVLKGALPNWHNLKPGTYAVNAEANCGVEVLKADCGSLTVNQVELICGSVPTSGVAGVAISSPDLTCNNGAYATDIAWTDAPVWNNPVQGTYSNIRATATCGNVTGVIANCNSALTIEPVKLTCNSASVSGVAGTAITERPSLTCNNNQAASDHVWENVPDWNNPEMGEYSDITVTADCGSVANLRADCSGTLKVSCSAINNTDEQYCSAGVMKNYGSVEDNAGNPYKTVVIGTQTWMAENLNYEVDGSVCYDNDPANCDIYGRMYNWATAMALPSDCNNSSCKSQVQSKHRGICPSSWHIPSEDEWDILLNFAGGWSIAGKKLKATSGWSYYHIADTDNYGFSALPGGYGYYSSYFHHAGNLGNWWSSNEYNNVYAYYRYMTYNVQSVRWDEGWGNLYKSPLFSVRCVQD